jgi:hypothetical protein
MSLPAASNPSRLDSHCAIFQESEIQGMYIMGLGVRFCQLAQMKAERTSDQRTIVLLQWIEQRETRSAQRLSTATTRKRDEEKTKGEDGRLKERNVNEWRFLGAASRQHSLSTSQNVQSACAHVQVMCGRCLLIGAQLFQTNPVCAGRLAVTWVTLPIQEGEKL